MDPLAPQDGITRDADLTDWQTFCQAYYQPILRAICLMRIPEDTASDLAQSFLVKAIEKDFLDHFRQVKERERQQGRTARFRKYLYASLKNHVRDAFRERKVRTVGLADDAATALEGDPIVALDPDALYALDVLGQALSALRRHCERTGKPHIWRFFEELILTDEFRGRPGLSREELLQDYPGKDSQFIDNSLTTAKRAFRRLIEEAIPRGLRGDWDPAERFREWMEILRGSHASQFDRLHVAYRVVDPPDSKIPQAPSTALIIPDLDLLKSHVRYEEPPSEPDDDELAILLSRRLETPLWEMVDVNHLEPFIPRSSPLWHGVQPFHPGGRARSERLLCLLTLIDPLPEEALALEQIDLLGLLGRLKRTSKQYHHGRDPAMPDVLAKLLYTLVNVVAYVRTGSELHSIGSEKLAKNVRWFLNRSWLDSRLQSTFEEGLAALQPCR
jgi:hypothetical protein